MEFEALSHNGVLYKWSSTRESEHPDFILVCDEGEIWVQVERTPALDIYYDLFNKNKVKFPIPLNVAQEIVLQVVRNGYIKSYFETDVGLIFDENGQLIQN